MSNPHSESCSEDKPLATTEEEFHELCRPLYEKIDEAKLEIRRLSRRHRKEGKPYFAAHGRVSYLRNYAKRIEKRVNELEEISKAYPNHQFTAKQTNAQRLKSEREKLARYKEKIHQLEQSE